MYAHARIHTEEKIIPQHFGGRVKHLLLVFLMHGDATIRHHVPEWLVRRHQVPPNAAEDNRVDRGQAAIDVCIVYFGNLTNVLAKECFNACDKWVQVCAKCLCAQVLNEIVLVGAYELSVCVCAWCVCVRCVCACVCGIKKKEEKRAAGHTKWTSEVLHKWSEITRMFLMYFTYCANK